MDVPLEPRTTAVLLAAGAGTRLGLRAKALLPFRGRVLVEVLAEVLLDGGCREVVVVLGAEAERVLTSTNLTSQDHDVRVVVNTMWRSGMAGSFRLGLGAAPPDDHVIIALVDQPGLNAKTVRALLAAHRPGRVTAAAYANASGKLRRGHPLILDACLRVPAAESATGDSGARMFLQTNPRLLDLVDCSNHSTGEDLDTREQLYLLD
ncbi:nicotine blue oxidoreductase [Arthrobacter sp. Rue61a]|uniref:nicotine blue oxidoreductase n=1 Tax=Arthrobacter sp. Rue61a TaxID=1118963 RepID=UPI00030979F3|nr:nucleotidyltransferase family protein [Arthrobacter sp. Rue61a]